MSSQVQQGASYKTALRMISLLLALGMAGLILTYPKALAHTSHGLLMLVMLGVSAGFVHGVGFVQEHRVWRIMFGPAAAWALMSIGAFLFWAGQ